MTLTDMFGNARWISAKDSNICPLFRKNFYVENIPSSAKITILGFGGFVFYINGKKVTDELFLPITSEFEARSMPDGQKLSPRAYCYRYDITQFIRKGKNTLSVILGNGWYDMPSFLNPAYGNKKLCFSVKLTNCCGEEVYVSDCDTRYTESFVKRSSFPNGIEEHSYIDWSDEMLQPDYDDSMWATAELSKPLDTEYEFTNCPHDKVIAVHTPVLTKEYDNVKVYDSGKNLSGYPVLRSSGSGKITVEFSEERTEDGNLLEYKIGWFRQKLTFEVDESGRSLFPLFTWQGFRYFRVTGPATVESVLETHAEIEVSSSFESSDETLNWLYKTYLNTQLNNIHTGVPSDCPHLERRGYTGDGQLACRAAMACLGAEELYRKWILDISDCQDRVSGHVQYTAPYVESGGGPGGWGCAIVVLPYEFWKYYGDDSFAREMYPQMLKYFEFMESHSENLLVKVDMPENAWCLGEWCTPTPVALPAPFINNYFYVKAMQKAIEIAEILGFSDDIPMLEKRIEERRHATKIAYMNPWDGNFIGCLQGANAFALDMGIGDQRTKNKFIEHYEKEPWYDTGIFGTDIVTRLLFEYDRADLAYKLMTADEPWGFGKWKKVGATTLWEYWYDYRSHNHPMFGAVTAYLFEYILGIKQKDGSFGYRRIIIDPAKIDSLPRAKGHITVKGGIISVEAETVDGIRKIKVEIPEGVEAELVHQNGETEILTGPAKALF